MGAFFTNVQVLIGGLAREVAQRELINTITEFICADDFIETSNPAEADRSVMVVIPKDGRWISIFDEATETQDTYSLIELAIIASRVAGKAAIAIQVHDSDICELYLCRNGEKVDAFNSDLDNTLYEQSCSLHGQITNGRNWCQRFLRAASERIWLSTELRKYLANETALTEFCEEQEVGQALRLSLKPGVKLSRLEEALQPLLPSAQDWFTAMQNRPRGNLYDDEPETR